MDSLDLDVQPEVLAPSGVHSLGRVHFPSRVHFRNRTLRVLEAQKGSIRFNSSSVFLPLFWTLLHIQSV